MPCESTKRCASWSSELLLHYRYSYRLIFSNGFFLIILFFFFVYCFLYLRVSFFLCCQANCFNLFIKLLAFVPATSKEAFVRSLVHAVCPHAFYRLPFLELLTGTALQLAVAYSLADDLHVSRFAATFHGGGAFQMEICPTHYCFNAARSRTHIQHTHT